MFDISDMAFDSSEECVVIVWSMVERRRITIVRLSNPTNISTPGSE
jgi:hypothetical protein